MNNFYLLTKYEIRHSGPRKKVIESIFSLGRRHFSVEDVLRHLKQKKRGVSRASAYRTINIFSKKGLLRQVDTGKGFKMYEMAPGSSHHDHMYCLKCANIVEFEEKTIENLQKAVCKKNRFYPMGHTLRIVGLCDVCRTRDARKR